MKLYHRRFYAAFLAWHGLTARKGKGAEQRSSRQAGRFIGHVHHPAFLILEAVAQERFKESGREGFWSPGL